MNKLNKQAITWSRQHKFLYILNSDDYHKGDQPNRT
jgi:hypothetical protein